MKEFEIGKTYWMRSVCDYKCIWYCKIVSRTARFITMEVSGYVDPVRVIVTQWDDAEHCSPLGKYSMSPLLRAENEEEL